MNKTKERNYSHEHQLRLKRNKKRLHAEIDGGLYDAFQAMLKDRNLTYKEWLSDKITQEIKEQ